MICFDAAAGVRSVDMKRIEMGTYLLYGAEVLRRAINLGERDVIPIHENGKEEIPVLMMHQSPALYSWLQEARLGHRL